VEIKCWQQAVSCQRFDFSLVFWAGAIWRLSGFTLVFLLLLFVFAFAVTWTKILFTGPIVRCLDRSFRRSVSAYRRSD